MQNWKIKCLKNSKKSRLEVYSKIIIIWLIILYFKKKNMKRFSIWSQDFEELIRMGSFYLDKTKLVFDLVDSNSKYYFFSRPRRFGKSLLLSMMKNIFLGKKELFKWLYIYDKWKFEEYPVIYISFGGYKKSMDVKEFIKENWMVYIEGKEIELWKYKKLDFWYILKEIKKQTWKQTVILIDEYDKPVLKYLWDIEKAEEMRDFFSDFYAPIKDNDANIRLFFLCWLTKLMKMSVFSEINNLDDISIKWPYVDLIWYTQKEVESNFENEIREIAKEQWMSYEELIIKLKEEYNWFNFGDKNKLLYNPRDINSFVNKKQFWYYWAESWIPSGISEFIKENVVDIQKIMDKEKINELWVTETWLRVHNLNNLKPEILFFQAWYLTIREMNNDNILYLKFPNKETEQVMIEYFLELSKINFDIVQWKKVANKITEWILQNESIKIQEWTRKLIYEIAWTTPWSWLANNPEWWLKTLVWVAIRMNSIYRWWETEWIIWRTDMHIPKWDTIYVVEVKVDRSTKECIKQIEEKYEKQYKKLYKKIVKIGVNWDRKEKVVDIEVK